MYDCVYVKLYLFWVSCKQWRNAWMYM